MSLSTLQRDFLEATRSLVAVQQGLLQRFQQLLNISAYDYWIRRLLPDCVNDELCDADWTYVFHGFELDVVSRQDRRFARLELGPHGMDNTFSVWSVGLFVLCSETPWPTYPKLCAHLYKTSRSPDSKRTAELFDSLIEVGYFIPCDSQLLELRNKHTVVDEFGRTTLDLPDEIDPMAIGDLFLSSNFVLSALHDS